MERRLFLQTLCAFVVAKILPVPSSDSNRIPLLTHPPDTPKYESVAVRHEWVEEDYLLTSEGDLVEVATGEGSYLRAGSILRVEDAGECMLVHSIQEDKLGVARAFGSSVVHTIKPGSKAIHLGYVPSA